MPGDVTRIRPRPAYCASGARLCSAVLAYHLVVIGILTLSPFHFRVPEQVGLMLGGTGFDFGANVLLFVPSGFLFRLARPPARGGHALGVLFAGLLTSLAIETAQLFEPARFSSPLDVLANGVGAWAGALACDRVAGRIRPDVVLGGRISLETPLMGLTFLLVPILWLGSFTAQGDAVRFGMLVLPGLFGASLLADVHRHRLGGPGAASGAGVAVGAGAGMAVGLSPAAAAHPVLTVVLAVAIGGYTRLVAGRPLSAAEDRRFELRSLGKALPFFALHVLIRAWLGAASAPAGQMSGILSTLELAGLFTVLGYILAEWHGRLERSRVESAVSVVARALPLAALAVTGRFLPQQPAAAAAWLIAWLGAALHGAVIYQLQRAHIRALIAGAAEPGRVAGRRPTAAA